MDDNVWRSAEQKPDECGQHNRQRSAVTCNIQQRKVMRPISTHPVSVRVIAGLRQKQKHLFNTLSRVACVAGEGFEPIDQHIPEQRLVVL